MSTLVDAITRLDSAAGENFWFISKGRTTPDEKLYSAAVYPGRATTEDDEPLAIAEGDDLSAVVQDVALQMRDPDALRREHN